MAGCITKTPCVFSFGMLDTDGDGAITKEEYGKSYAKERKDFEMIDQNQDKVITEIEFSFVYPHGLVNPYSVFETKGPDYYFGQFWRWEGTSDPISITGIGVSDPDVDENCIFDSLKPCKFFEDPIKAYRCGNLDFNARVLIGAIGLNTADDLRFYENSRSAKGFTAQERFLTQAIRAIRYRVDTPENIASGLSVVSELNTQYKDSPQEFLFLRVSDQGLTGANGLAESARDKSGQEGLKIYITIAAVNDAPTLQTPTDFTAYEDVPMHLKGLDGNDVDSDEKITSGLASSDWTSSRHNFFYLNKLRITAELKGFGNDKGRGLIFLNSDARDLWVVSNGSQVFVSIRSVSIDNYACAAKETIFRPGSYKCGQGSVPSLVGQPCRGSWDHHTCSLIARGKVQVGSTNTSIVLAKTSSLLDSNLKQRLDRFVPRTQWNPDFNQLDDLSLALQWSPSLRIEIADGPSRGMYGFIDHYNASTIEATLWIKGTYQDPVSQLLVQTELDARGIPPANSTWEIYMEPQRGTCMYHGNDLQKLCAHETFSASLSKVWWSPCEKGQEDKCICVIEDECSTEGQYRLHLNYTKPAFRDYIPELVNALNQLNKTCGGLPFRDSRFFTSPLAKRCEDESHCSENVLRRCIPGQTCKCCGNLTVTCSEDDDCLSFGNPFEKRQLCGCTSGYETMDGTNIWEKQDTMCCANLDKRCKSDSDCQADLEGSKCGCAKYYPMCGPYTRDGLVQSMNEQPMHSGYGQPCTYRFPRDGGMGLKCDNNMFAYEGTKDARILTQLMFFQIGFDEGSMDGQGSTRIEIYGEKTYSILALRGLRYLTYNPNYPFYNRLYRLPEEERDPTTFKIDANDFDVLHVTADDMGNSGGGYRDVKVVQKTVPILSLAVNNPPKLSGPRMVTVIEDVPYHIINDPKGILNGNPIYGINVSDPDQTNFGFNEPRMVFGESLGFMVNLTVKHGCLFVNESFLKYGPEYAGRAANRAVLGGPSCPLDVSFDLGGCTIRLKDYGQEKAGLHAVKCTDFPRCKSVVRAPCYSDVSPGHPDFRHCYGGRACTKILALEGRFPDVNKVLANVTYLSDPDFNTGYGYDESLTVEVSDNGIIGDPPIEAYTDKIVIPITVRAVNDAPTVGRLQDAECVVPKPDGTVSLADIKTDKRLFAIDPVIDRIDVNEDTEFTIMPDRLWIADVDAEEAEIRSTYVSPKCASSCGSVVADPRKGCCMEDTCPDLCKKMKLVSEGGLPSEVLVEFKVDVGKLSFYPPPTRTLIRGITFMTNLSLADIKAPKYAIERCEDQVLCSRNQSRIWIRARLPRLQLAMKQGFLRYVGKENWAGTDMLYVWVSDDGYTDPKFVTKLTAESKLPITVVAINDPPSITYPGGQGCVCDPSTGTCNCQKVPPLQFTKGYGCRNDWMLFGFTDPWPKGVALDCDQPNSSKVPNIKETYEKFPELSNRIVFDDVDMNETPNGNMTVIIKIGRKNAGHFTIREMFSTVSLYQWLDMDEMVNLELRGKMREINALMDRLFFDADQFYSGPAPFQIVAVDNNNFGICTPKYRQTPYKCNRVFCANIFSGYFENKFFCEKPVGADNSVIKHLPPASMSCEDIRRLPVQCPAGCRADPKARDPIKCAQVSPVCTKIIVREKGDWSGPWSCLGCGYYNLATRQVEDVDERNPSIPGLTRATVDVLVGGAAACLYSNCSTCNAAPRSAARPHGTGCGWCPSFCKGLGKCMIEYNGAPLFESCRTMPDLPFPGNLAYRQCRQGDSNLILIIGVSVPSLMIGLYTIYLIVRWLQRRHGSLVVYFKKLRFDITYKGRQLYLLPPEGANYLLFFVLMLALLIAFIIFTQSSQSGPFYFQKEVYLDSLTSMDFELDNCNVRFMPVRNYPSPTNKIDAVKIRFAYFEHPNIVLEDDACSPGVVFKLINTRSPAEKYTNFYCNVEILIPDRYVVPTTTINAIGSNLTTVRAGPMDSDTLEFGLEFGSNEFIMKGELMIARLDNITAKHLKYDVRHGSLLATNVSDTPFATFNSITADISVTTFRMTTAHFWQKSGNMMCLTAATLYVDSSCDDVCDFVPTLGAPAAAATTQGDFRVFDRYYRRRHLLTNLTGAGPLDTEARRALCKDVPKVPDCVTPECDLIQTPQCLCKPTCDMVKAEDLDFNGYKGVEGKCDEEGKCCRTLCGGYSRADLFPYPKTVRCGTCQDQKTCSMPQCGMWNEGQLEQQWWFTSVSGQMSLAAVHHSITILDRSMDESAVHSYKGQEPVKDVMSSITLDFNYADKLALDTLFHPGGASAPNEEWFWLRIAGPGAPPSTMGSLLWVLSVRFLVVPDYFLAVVSNGFLNPKKKSGSVRLRPGYCPPVLREGDPIILKRVVQLQQLISRTLQYFPADKPAKAFPFGSMVAWIPLEGLSSKFVLDPATNQLGFTEIQPWQGDGPILFLIVILSFTFPLAITALFLYKMAIGFRAFIVELRALKLRRENAILNMYEQARMEKMSIYDREAKLEIPPEKHDEMTARVSFFFVLDHVVGWAEYQKTVYVEVLLVCLHLGFVATPVLYINYVATSWEAGFKAYHCENVIAKEKCYSKPEPISTLLNFSVLCHTLVCAAELSVYYLKIPFSMPLRLLRYIFYASFVFFLGIATWMLLLNFTWICLGVLQKPKLLAPYALAAILMLAVGASYYGKLTRFRVRVAHAVGKRIVIFASKLGEKFPKRVVEAVLDGNTENALNENGLSQSSIVLKTIGLMLLLILLHSFIFVGFQAFTDPSDGNAALINTFIIAVVNFSLGMVAQGDGDQDWAKEQTQLACQQVLMSMGRVFQMLQDQLHLAKKIIVKQRKEHRREKIIMLGSDVSEEEEEEESSSASYVTESSSSEDASEDDSLGPFDDEK